MLKRSIIYNAIKCLSCAVLLIFMSAAFRISVIQAQPDDDAVIGTVEQLLQGTNEYRNLYSEMRLCDAAADAVKAATEADVAILNGGDFYHNLEGGTATWADIKYIFEDNADKTLGIAHITGADLVQILEHGVSHAVADSSREILDTQLSQFDGFPHVSGIRFEYDPTAPEGERVTYVERNDGSIIEPNSDIILAATEYMLSGGYGYPAVDYESQNISLAESFAGAFKDRDLKVPDGGRVKAIGLSDSFALSRAGILVLSLAAIMICFAVVKVTNHNKPNENRYEESFNNEI